MVREISLLKNDMSDFPSAADLQNEHYLHLIQYHVQRKIHGLEEELQRKMERRQTIDLFSFRLRGELVKNGHAFVRWRPSFDNKIKFRVTDIGRNKLITDDENGTPSIYKDEWEVIKKDLSENNYKIMQIRGENLFFIEL